MKILYLLRKFEDGKASAEYAKSMASYSVNQGHDAAIVAFDDGSHYTVDEDVEVHRVQLPFEGDNLFNWSMMLNNELKSQAKDVFDQEPDIIHAVDWTSIPGGVSLSKNYETPLVITFQSTENERGFEGEHAEIISELEWDGAFEADLAVATSEDTKNSLLFDLDVPEEKLEKIDPYQPDWEHNLLNHYKTLMKNKKEVKN